jgi:two-component system, OmpR family, response regulator ChvI
MPLSTPAPDIDPHSEPRQTSLQNSSDHKTRVVFVGGDRTFAEALGLALLGFGIEATRIATISDAIQYLASRNDCEVMLVEHKLSDLTALDLLRRLASYGVGIPVVVLAEHGSVACDAQEEMALKSGAADFVVKSRGTRVIAKRIELAGRRTKNSHALLPAQLKVGFLELKTNTRVALWHGQVVPLTVTEFRIVASLATNAGDNAAYRDIYDLVRGRGFVGGRGPEGYRANVRAALRRIRWKFRQVDKSFAEIENHSGFGYRWLAPARDSRPLTPIPNEPSDFRSII